MALLSWPLYSVTSYFMLMKLSKQKIEPNIIIDIGANKGQFSVSSSKIFPNACIYSYEPVPETFAKLQLSTKTLDNVVIKSFGLGEQKDQVIMNTNTHSHSSSMLHLANGHKQAFPDAKESAQVLVDVATLDDEFENIELNGTVLLKIDVQGYEAHVLKGAKKLLVDVDYVLLEVSFKPMYEGEALFDEIVELLSTFGFRFLRPIDWLESPNTGEVLQMDALFVRSLSE